MKYINSISIVYRVKSEILLIIKFTPFSGCLLETLIAQKKKKKNWGTCLWIIVIVPDMFPVVFTSSVDNCE